ncbi:MAG: MFS transporter, partial [Streptosporangiaceae bacterium]
MAKEPAAVSADRYRWVALANTTAAMFMATLDGSIVIIALPAIFRGIGLDPLAPGSIFYLLWMIMGYRLVQAVLVVSLGRLGDMYGRVRIYNAGFVVFTFASVLLSFDPFRSGGGAMWLIGWRVLQAVGGSMLMANSAAILTDAFPADRRGFALGTNQIAGLAGQFVGLVAGGLLAAIDWRAGFWINVPVGVFGTLWAYLRLKETGERHRARVDWWGNVTFAVGLGAILVGITEGIQPYHGHSMGWANPTVIGLVAGGLVLLIAFGVIETRIAEPMFQLGLFRIRAFTAGSMAGLVVAIARGGQQFMLIIWLQGIWLPLHGYSFSDTPLWAGIFLLPLTAGFLVSGPTSGILSDRFGSRAIATAGMVVFGGSFIGLMLLPVNFPYLAFALLIAVNGIGSGMFAAPNSSSIMGSVPARHRGAASGMRSTFQNSGTALSIGVFFSLMIAGLAATLPKTLTAGLTQHGVPYAAAHQIGSLPPVASLFAAVLGVNPVQHLLSSGRVLSTLPAASQQLLTGREFFPGLISAPFHHGLVVVFAVAAALAAVAALASVLRGGRHVPPRSGPRPAAETPAPDRTGPDRTGPDRSGQALPQAQVMARAQGAGEQGRQGRGDSDVGERERRGEAALAAQQVQGPQPVPQGVELGAHGAGQAGAAARGPALHAVDVGQQPGQVVVPSRPAGEDDEQCGLAHRDREVRLRSVVGADQRGRADVPSGGRVGRHQLARLGQHQAGSAAPDGAHLGLRHPAQGVQREHVELLAQRADQLVAPAESVDRLGDQRGRDVVPGGEPEPLVRVTQQP